MYNNIIESDKNICSVSINEFNKIIKNSIDEYNKSTPFWIEFTKRVAISVAIYLIIRNIFS